MKKTIAILLITTYAFSTNLILGVVPQQSPLKLSKKWLQVTNYLKKETGINVIFKTEKSIPSFETKLYKGEYDLAYMNPYHFVQANKKQNYIAVIRAKKNIKGILLSKDENVNFSIENLKGKTFLFPAPNAFAGVI